MIKITVCAINPPGSAAVKTAPRYTYGADDTVDYFRHEEI